jgi:hypothetical protein
MTQAVIERGGGGWEICRQTNKQVDAFVHSVGTAV